MSNAERFRICGEYCIFCHVTNRNEQANKMGEAGIQLLLNLNSDLTFRSMILVFTANLQLFKSADFTPVQK